MEILNTNQVRLLVELQRMDTAIDAQKVKAAAVPVSIAALNKEFKDKENAVDAARSAFHALLLKKKESELKIAEADEEVRKYQRDLNAVKENNAFKALLSQIEACKAKKDSLETSVLDLMEAIDRASVEDNKLKGEIAQLEAGRKAQSAALEAGLKELEAAIGAASAKRNAAAAVIEPELLQKYEHLRARRAGLAVAEVREDADAGKFSCSGCHMGLTTQKVMEARRRDVFVICPDCTRLLYSVSTVFG